ncbi:cysteine desulfurase mitochondrial-like [Trifolium pratense]|uniref:Cysteine desulfurase mitochondrial-like n=1 Tax=Trifolium pratense TaxID=57577 RepID=A0A2K3PMS8_TRIPR|nr:cysteine desulfurase mitochondrial-like [Trifolium pratense]
MENWKNVALTKEEEEDGFEADGVEVCDEEIFANSLVGKLWTTNPFNGRIFKQVIVQAWRLKNPVEIQDLNKNLFLFRFSSKRDLETVLRNGPWSFDRNIVILKRISGDEQPSDIEMHSGEFWTRIYDLPLKLRSDEMARKLGDVLGKFVEVDNKESNRMGKFLWIKSTIDLRNPLKRGTIIKFQGKSLRIFFKYERLPTFCFVCGRIGHQLKDCEDMEGKDETEFEDIVEKELPFGQWLRASPLPKITGEVKKDTSTGSCSKNLFTETSQSKEGSVEKEKGLEVEQVMVASENILQIDKGATQEEGKNTQAVESVAESLSNVVISKSELGKFDKGSNTKPKPVPKPRKKWTRRAGTKKGKTSDNVVAELGKRQLAEVTIVEEEAMELCGGDPKRRLTTDVTCENLLEGVLEDQHLLNQ